MRVLIDTNIILDFLLEREPFLQDAEALFQAVSMVRLVGYVTATTLTDIFYIATRHTQNVDRANQAVASTLATMEICSVDRSVLELALASTTVDFEDSLQVACAELQGLDAIVTRDADFSAPSIPVLSIHQLLQQLESIE